MTSGRISSESMKRNENPLKAGQGTDRAAARAASAMGGAAQWLDWQEITSCNAAQQKRRPRAGSSFLSVIFRCGDSRQQSEALCLADGADRALGLTCAAIDAGIRVDNIMLVALRNRLDRTLSSAGTAADAGIVDKACHNVTSL